MYKRLIAIFIFMAVAPACIHANPATPCAPSGSLATYIGTPCTIGDKTFTFTGLSGTLSSSNIIVTPDATNATAPGFIITPAPGSAFSATNGSLSPEIFYTVSITNPASGALITGQTSSFSGVTATPTSSTNFFQVWSINDVCQGFSLAIFDETNGVVGTNATTNTVSCTPATSAGGNTALLLTATNGTLSVSSAAYYINETLPTPEPASVLLFSSGLSALGFGARRKWRRTAASQASRN